MAYFRNSSSGEVLEVQCADCPLGFGWNDPYQKRLFDAESIGNGCPVEFVQLMYNYDQVGIPKLKEAMTILINDAGTCQVRELLLKLRRESIGDGVA